MLNAVEVTSERILFIPFLPTIWPLFVQLAVNRGIRAGPSQVRQLLLNPVLRGKKLLPATKLEKQESRSTKAAVWPTRKWRCRLHWFEPRIIAKRILDLTNGYRDNCKLPRLAWDEGLADMALQKALELVSKEDMVVCTKNPFKVDRDSIVDDIARSDSPILFNAILMGARTFKVRGCFMTMFTKRVKYDVAKECVEELLISTEERWRIESRYARAAGVAAVQCGDPKDRRKHAWYIVQCFDQDQVPVATHTVLDHPEVPNDAYLAAPSAPLERPMASRDVARL